MANKQNFDLKTSLTVSLPVVIAILALSLAGLMHMTPITQLSEPVSATLFSSARAMFYLKSIAQHPHPTGTPENKHVQDYLVAELKRLGLDPHVQTALAINNLDQKRIVGIVHNVLVRVPGKAPGKALLIAAHYDSTHTGPGAADDGASVAAMLETLRALNNLPPLQNDLICIFTDGEEAGLLGAEAFVQEHPWAKRIGLVLNFEYRGNRGSLLMFETSQGNGKLIDGFATAAPHPLGNSFMYEIYKRLPNDTDMSVFKRSGIAGMNFAAIEGHTSYHTQLDRPELLQKASLQHQGETLLSLIKYFGNIDLAELQSADSIYFDAPGLGIVKYPVSWAPSLCGALFVLFGAVLALGLKCKELRAERTALGALAFLFIVPLLACVCQLLWMLLKHLHPQYQLMLLGDTYNSHWYFLAFVFLVIAMFGLVQSAIRRWIRPMELTVGAMAGWQLILVASSSELPGASFLFFWPLAPLLLATGWSFCLRDRNIASPMRVMLFILGIAPGIVMFVPFIKVLFVGLTLYQIGIVMGFLVLFLGLSAPLLDLLARSFIVPWPPLIAGLLFLLTGSFTAGFDQEHPRPNNLFYAQNSVTGKALWLSADQSLDEWTRTFFPNSLEKRRVQEIFGEKSTAYYWAGSAPKLPLQAPDIDLLANSSRSGIRKIIIQVRSLRHAPEFRVYVEGVAVISSKIENRVITEETIPEWSLQGFGFTEQGLKIQLNVEDGVPFKVRVIDLTYELPWSVMLPRPEAMMPQPVSLSDTVAVINTIDFK